MKKKLALLLVLLMLAALLAGCGASSTAAMASDTFTAPAAAPAEYKSEAAYGGYIDNGYDYAYAEESYYEAEMPMPEPSASATASNLATGIPNGVKLIYRADISLESTQFDDAVTAIRTLAEQCGGYYESSNLDNYSAYRYAYYTIRVPAEQFETFCTAVSEISAEGVTFQMTNISRSAEDVSESYYDTESRLETQKTKLARLQELLAKAENMEDIITIESAISDTEWQIENLTGTLRHYDSLVGYSTICINISEVYKLTEIEEPAIGFGAKLAAAFQQGCTNFVNGLEHAALRFARAWVGWLIFFVIVAVVIFVVVRVTRRCKAKREAKRAAGVTRTPSRMPAPKAAQPEAPAEAPKEE